MFAFPSIETLVREAPLYLLALNYIDLLVSWSVLLPGGDFADVVGLEEKKGASPSPPASEPVSSIGRYHFSRSAHLLNWTTPRLLVDRSVPPDRHPSSWSASSPITCHFTPVRQSKVRPYHYQKRRIDLAPASMLSLLTTRSFCSIPKILSAVREERIVTVKWDDGKIGEFPVIWLRDTSTDEKTYSIGPAMKARNLVMNTFDVQQSPLSMKVENNELIMEWGGDVHSRFPSNWLRERNPSCNEARKRRRQVYLFPENTWGKEEIERDLKKFTYQEVTTKNKALHDFLEAVCLDGIAVIQGAPKGERGAVEEIGERIGLIHNTHFGKVFEVCTKPDASNMAYASGGSLPFHTDFPSLANPPQLQMLHMLTKAAEGGNSLFVDGFHVAELLRKERPEVFKTLTKYDMEYIEEGFDVHEGPDGQPKHFYYDMCARHRIIQLNEQGKVIKIQFGNAMRSWFYDCDSRKIQDIYDAMKVFTDYCYQERNILKFAMKEGDTVLWANTRVLHTRDGYRDAPGRVRTLTGCYFAWDIVKSRVRALRDQLNLPQNQPSV